MRTVGVKQLKARLSEYLRAVKRGETLLVTERDQVIAELRPPLWRGAAVDTLAEALDALAESGELTRAAQPKGDWRWAPRGLGLPAGSALRLLDEVREERVGG